MVLVMNENEMMVDGDEVMIDGGVQRASVNSSYVVQFHNFCSKSDNANNPLTLSE